MRLITLRDDGVFTRSLLLSATICRLSDVERFGFFSAVHDKRNFPSDVQCLSLFRPFHDEAEAG